MQNKGPIIIIDDDADDREIIKTSIESLAMENEVVFFDNTMLAFEYLKQEWVKPFLILSDINMPVMNGFQLRDKIHADPVLRRKCIPYIFVTTGGNSAHIWEAYSQNAQGFFFKPDKMQDWKELMESLFSYWRKSKKPD